MEALLAKEGQVENGNDDRLDELSQTMKEGFAQINKKLDQLPSREEIDQRFAAATREMVVRFATADRATHQRFDATDCRIDRVNSRLEHMVRAMLIVGGGFLGNLLTDKI